MTTPNFVIQVCGWLVGIPLEVLLISALARGRYRQYPLVFFYALANLVTTLVEIPPYTETFITGDPATWSHAARVYWVNEWILQVLVFATVLSLIDRATLTSPWRRVMRAGLSVGAILFAAALFYIEYLPPPVKIGYWMTPWTRDLNVGATVLDLTLWMILIASRKSDRRLLLLSGALGMQFTGEAVGEALRNLSMPKMMQTLSLTGSIVVMMANLACLYVWWQTFRAPRINGLSKES